MPWTKILAGAAILAVAVGFIFGPAVPFVALGVVLVAVAILI